MPTYREFPLPDAGEGLTEAEIVAWSVAPGDEVAVNQPIVEIETAKSLVELPSPWAGVVAAVLVPEGTTVEVGTPIIRIDVDPAGGSPAVPDDAPAVGADVPSVPGEGEAAEGSPVAQDAAGAGSTAGAGSGAGSAAGSGAGTEGAVTADDAAGGAVLVGYGVAGGAAGPRRRRRAAGTGEPGEAAPAAPTAASAAPVPVPVPAAREPHVLAKPPVRKLARDLGVDLASVPGTGPGGIVTREDVVEYAEAAAEPQTLATYEDEPWLAQGTVTPDARQTRVPVKSVRKRTAEAMVTSAFTAPHVTEFVTVDVTRTMRLVAELRGDKEFADVRVTPLLIAAKALLLAVRRHPEINASWDDAAQEIVYKHYVNLGIAAATPRGLVVPNIKDAHRLDLHALAVELGELTQTARAGRTTPAAMSDGTITITNVGVFGIDTGTPILNPGEAGILAFGAVRETPWVHKGKIRKRWVTQLALSFDHRLVDGELGARVLADVARVLEDPARALVWG